MAGSISLSLSQQFDSLGRPLSGGFLYTYAAGTTTPQSAYQDTGLTVALPNPITLDSAGRLPQMFFADGNIKIRLTDANLVTQVAADNVLVIGQSSGGGGGATVDPTTVLQTGWLQPIYGTGAITGFVRANGRTIGAAASGATERANADTQSLYVFLYGQDANLAVSGGRGASAAADFAALKTIALPDFRGRAISGLVDMGNTPSTTLTTAVYGTDPTVLGAAGGAQANMMARANMPDVSLSVTGSANVTSTGSTIAAGTKAISGFQGGGINFDFFQSGTMSTGSVTSNGFVSGSTSSLNSSVPQTAMTTVSPLKLVTVYLKL